jgi:hypothetical protein
LVPVTLATLDLVTLKVRVNCCCCLLEEGNAGATEVTEAERELAVLLPPFAVAGTMAVSREEVVEEVAEGEREERVRVV